ncbi:hypothetical protein IC582_003462 [Cucumis melo]
MASHCQDNSTMEPHGEFQSMSSTSQEHRVWILHHDYERNCD